jgi:acetoin utilization deacetylase AcuC-like enzyme
MHMHLYYADVFNIPLPSGHRFPGEKYRLLREALLHQGIIAPWQLELSPQASRADLLRAHDPGYVDAFLAGSLPAEAMRQIGMPWSEHLVHRTLATMGGAVASMRDAFGQGFCAQLSGGTHHAHADSGSGYCVFNDHAIAALTALEEGLAARVAIVDLDVHQGDGNAAILSQRPEVFVFSIHGEKNFPFRKVASTLDIGLPDGTGDEAYLRALHEGLDAVLAFRPGLVLYQAGVDPLAEDKLGRLALTYDGLMRRDRLVLETFARAGVPLSLGIGGGYCDPIGLSVAAYANSFAVAKAVYGF